MVTLTVLQVVGMLVGSGGVAAAVASVVTALVQARTANRAAASAEDAKVRDDLWRELGAQRERVALLEERVKKLGEELVEERTKAADERARANAERERASRARILADELRAAATGCIGDVKACPVRRLAEDRLPAQEDRPEED